MEMAMTKPVRIRQADRGAARGARGDGNFIGLLAEVSRELIQQNRKAFALRLADACVNTASYDKALRILETNIIVVWPPARFPERGHETHLQRQGASRHAHNRPPVFSRKRDPSSWMTALSFSTRLISLRAASLTARSRRRNGGRRAARLHASTAQADAAGHPGRHGRQPGWRDHPGVPEKGGDKMTLSYQDLMATKRTRVKAEITTDHAASHYGQPVIVLPDGNPLDYQSAILLGYRVERATKTEQEMLAKWQPEHAAAIFGGAEMTIIAETLEERLKRWASIASPDWDGICVICGHDFLRRLPRRLYLSLMQQRAPGLQKETQRN